MSGFPGIFSGVVTRPSWTVMYQNFMDLVHELCPVQLLEVTKKSDNLSG